MIVDSLSWNGVHDAVGAAYAPTGRPALDGASFFVSASTDARPVVGHQGLLKRSR